MTPRSGALLLMLALVSLPTFSVSGSDLTAFVDVSILTMKDNVVRDHFTVVVRGGEIAAVGPVDEVTVPEDAVVIEGAGRFLMPGLIDLHVHLNESRDLVLYPAHGVTTVVNLGGWLTDLDLQRDIEDQTIVGPRYLVCGPQITGIETEEAAIKEVAAQAETGYDCIKIYNDVSAEVYRTLVEEAERRSLLSFSHIPRNLGWKEMLKAKPDAVAHAEEFLYSPLMSEDIEPIANGMIEGGMSLIATLVTYDTIGKQIADIDQQLRRGEMRLISPYDRGLWGPKENTYLARFDESDVPEFRRRFAIQNILVKRFHDAGVRILLGTDGGGVPFVFPGSSALEELHNLVDAGLDPWDALRGGTSAAAEFLGLKDRIGTIEVGRDADLLLLMGDPSSDITNVSLQAGTMVRGRWIDRSSWNAQLDALADAYSREEELIALFDREGPVAFAEAIEKEIESGLSSPVGERTINELGYRLLSIDEDSTTAIVLFLLNTRLHSESFNAWDSLGDAYREDGDISAAIECYSTSLELNHKHHDARNVLKALTALLDE